MRVAPGDIIVADNDGVVVVVPSDEAGKILKKAEELDHAEHGMIPMIEQLRSIGEAVKKVGRL